MRHKESLLCPSCGVSRDVEGDLVLPPDWACSACGWAPTFQAGVALTKPEDCGRIAGIDPAAFAQLDAVEAGHFWFESRRDLIVDLLRRFAPRAESYFEIGCGGGFVLSRIVNSRSWRRVVGTELHVEGLAIARMRLPASVELIQICAGTPIASNAFDVAGAFDVIEHVPDDLSALGVMHRALRPGGMALITVPQHMWLWSKSDDIALHQRRYRRGELEGKLRRLGFEVVFSSSFNALLLPAALIHRLRPAKDELERIAQEMRPVGALNEVLKAVLTFETALTRYGMRWPVGVSRVVAARKV